MFFAALASGHRYRRRLLRFSILAIAAMDALTAAPPRAYLPRFSWWSSRRFEVQEEPHCSRSARVRQDGNGKDATGLDIFIAFICSTTSSRPR